MQMEIVLVLVLPALFAGAMLFRQKYHRHHFSFQRSILFAAVATFVLYAGMIIELQLLY